MMTMHFPKMYFFCLFSLAQPQGHSTGKRNDNHTDSQAKTALKLLLLFLLSFVFKAKLGRSPRFSCRKKYASSSKPSSLPRKMWCMSACLYPERQQ